MSEQGIKLKICLVGDPAVGKTSLVKRFVLDQFDDRYMSTMGAKVMLKDVETAQKEKVVLLIWDLMGQKQYKIIESVVFEHVRGALIVCDTTRKDTLESIGTWVEAIHKYSKEIPIIILANKSDLSDGFEFGEEELKVKAAEFGAKYFITSAKTGDNVEQAFNDLSELMVAQG